jgi:hypothetical protein
MGRMDDVAIITGTAHGIGAEAAQLSRLIPILSKADSLGIPKSPAT